MGEAALTNTRTKLAGRVVCAAARTKGHGPKRSSIATTIKIDDVATSSERAPRALPMARADNEAAAVSSMRVVRHLFRHMLPVFRRRTLAQQPLEFYLLPCVTFV